MNRIDLLYEDCRRRYGAGRDVRLFRAPGRVNLIGEHTDYNDGFVLPVAIDRDVMIAAAARDDGRVRLHALDYDATLVFDLNRIAPEPEDTWARYVKGVAAVLQREGVRLRGVDGVMSGTVPIGAGLSSSAALEVALATMFCAFADVRLPGPRLARLCQRAENEYAGVRCGIMDPFISRMARPRTALFLDCRSLAFEHVPFDVPGYALVIADTNQPRGLADSAYNRRRRECEEGARLLGRRIEGVRALRDVTPEVFERHRASLPEVVARRCAHVITENARVLRSVEVLRRRDMAQFGRLMNASHDSLRDDYAVSCEALDVMVIIARGCEGVLGSRMTGAGFGGCTVSLVVADEAEALERAIHAAYPARTGLRPEVYVCRPAAGAGEVKRNPGYEKNV